MVIPASFMDLAWVWIWILMVINKEPYHIFFLIHTKYTCHVWFLVIRVYIIPLRRIGSFSIHWYWWSKPLRTIRENTTMDNHHYPNSRNSSTSCWFRTIVVFFFCCWCGFLMLTTDGFLSKDCKNSVECKKWRSTGFGFGRVLLGCQQLDRMPTIPQMLCMNGLVEGTIYGKPLYLMRKP